MINMDTSMETSHTGLQLTNELISDSQKAMRGLLVTREVVMTGARTAVLSRSPQKPSTSLREVNMTTPTEHATCLRIHAAGNWRKPTYLQ
jgi:hypothetical protein